jgi:hypothetical protein
MGSVSPIHSSFSLTSSQRDAAKEHHMANKNKAPKEILVVGSKVKDVIRDAGLRSDGELIQAVSDKVHELLGAAIERCKSNNRSTVRPHDL